MSKEKPKKKKKKNSKEYMNETKEFTKMDLEEKDNIETIDELLVKEKKKKRKRIKKTVKRIIFIIIVIILGILYARFISTKGLIVKEYAINTSDLTSEYDGLKIVQISDIHYGSTVHKKELKNVVKETNKQNPDIIIFTGDLIEPGTILSNSDIETIINCFNDLNASYGYYAVRGNHDYDKDTKDYFENIMTKTKFTILDNSYDLIYYNSTTPIRIIGFDDLTKGNPSYDEAFTLPEGMDKSPYTIIITHEPDQIDKFIKKHSDFNVMFSGHSHLGQVRLPIVGALWTPTGSKKYYDEHYIIDNKDLYISGGIGTSTLPLRFLNKPSISLYRFYTK